LYCKAFAAAVPVLRVYVWSAVFVFIGTGAQTRLLVGSDTTHVILVKTLAGAISNILLNILWIPRYGTLGAAWASVVSYAVAAYFVFDLRHSWPTTKLMLLALHPRHLFSVFNYLHGERLCEAPTR
jgi:O-antigen/teichoic acid export membrane protein